MLRCVMGACFQLFSHCCTLMAYIHCVYCNQEPRPSWWPCQEGCGGCCISYSGSQPCVLCKCMPGAPCHLYSCKKYIFIAFSPFSPPLLPLFFSLIHSSFDLSLHSRCGCNFGHFRGEHPADHQQRAHGEHCHAAATAGCEGARPRARIFRLAGETAAGYTG